jgi:diguanylate cyclase (GGDEF)-like protein
MKKSIDDALSKRMNSWIDWITSVKKKTLEMEKLIKKTGSSLENTFEIILKLLESLNKLSVDNKSCQDGKFQELLYSLKDNIGDIKNLNLEQQTAIKDTRKLAEKSISIFRSFYDKITKDPLTWLWNKEYINNILDILYEKEPVPEFFYVFADLDNLKVTNDTYWHDVGDILIKTFARYLREIFWEEKNYIARIQWDEFNIVSFDDMNTLNKKINKLRLWCENNKIKIKDKNISIQISFSIWYSASTKAKSIADLVRLADKRMYKEKYSKK